MTHATVESKNKKTRKMKKNELDNNMISEIFSEMALTSKEESNISGGEGGSGSGSGSGSGTGPGIPEAPLFDCWFGSCKKECKSGCKETRKK